MKIIKVQRTTEHEGYVIHTDSDAIVVAPLDHFQGDKDFLSKLNGEVLETVVKADKVVRFLGAITGDDLYEGVKGELAQFTDLTTIYDVGDVVSKAAAESITATKH